MNAPSCRLILTFAATLFLTGTRALQAGEPGAPIAPTKAAPAPVAEPYRSWQHEGELTILTTPEGANLPAPAAVEGFPLLVRLHRDWFDFSQAKAGGEDVRFSEGKGLPLAYQVDQWDAAEGTASLWVRIPRIQGNARQTIHMHWGKPDAASASDAKAVFDRSNGYLSVWHMGDTVRDDAGSLESRDVGTTATAGVVGKARHFGGQQGAFCGDAILNYPSGSSSHSTQAWFRPEQPNGTVVAWGNEQAQGKVVMQYRSPPHVNMDCYFSDGNVAGRGKIPMNQWAHVVHTYQKGESRVYVNGALDEVSTVRGAPLSIARPARLWLGGWYHHYDFIGSIDEVRVSSVARSAQWVRLEYENQKPLQTLVGPLVQPGSEFSVSPERLTVAEGKAVLFKAQAGGAQKVLWTLLRDGVETPVAVDRFAYTFDAGRVTADTSATLRFKAVYADSVKMKDIPITIREDIPEPVFVLQAPSAWDGRRPIEVVPQVTNLRQMQAKGAGCVKFEWNVAPIAVVKEVTPGKLLLKRALNSGLMVVTATASNGGMPTTQKATIAVTEPKHDPWIAPAPGKEEKPEDGQFYARDDNDEGTLFCNGTLTGAADSVFLKLFAGERLIKTETAVPATDRSYAFAVKLKPGLVKYRVDFGTRSDGRDAVLHTAGNLVCGDVFLVNGQSNAVAADWGAEEPPAFRSEWIRTFGSMSGSPKGERLWGEATYRSPEGKLQIGYWPMELARRLVESQKVPICILNGAVGGTRIDQHQRNAADPEDMTTIYGRLLWRVRQARLMHGVRAVFWHQGENDQGADGPSGGFGWETYRRYFLELAASWQEDFPNIRHYYVFQIWPNACAMGIDGSDSRLREVQRALPEAFSHVSLMSTLGVEPAGGCHYPPAGYAEIARLIAPLVERDQYGKRFTRSITPPNLRCARFSSNAKDEIALAFDQPVKWDDALAGQFYLDGEKGKVASGRVAENVVTLRLTAPTAARTITYLDSRQWSQKALLRGENGIAALTFCEVTIQPASATCQVEGTARAGEVMAHCDGLHGYIGFSATRPPARSEYSAGMGFYSAVWPLVDQPLANFQIGLAGSWITPDNSENKDKPLAPQGTLARQWPDRGPTWASVFQTVEGGLGYWAGNHFRYGPPKFSMYATQQCYDYEIGSPGWSFFSSSEALPDHRLGIAQLSNRLLIPPDGLPFQGNPNGQFLGYTWMALPFTDPTTEDPPTGDQSWTCFLSTANFKGPIAYYIPETWSKIGKLFHYPFLHGRGLDARPGEMGGGAMEINTVPRFDSQDARGVAYSKIPKLQFPVDDQGRAFLVQDVTYYSKAALYDAFKAWRSGGPACSGRFDAKGAWKSTLTTSTTRYDQAGKKLAGVERVFDTKVFQGNVWGLEWFPGGVSPRGVFPQYFQHVGQQRVAVSAAEVPLETRLLSQEFPLARRGEPYTSPTNGAWSRPGPKQGPCTVKLADGSLVTYSWYRFVDQPSFQQYHWSEDKKGKLQTLVERIHASWPIDRDYMVPPGRGALATLDPALIVAPPKGMEVGYVPIATRQSAE